MSELATLVHQTMLMKMVTYRVIGRELCFHHIRDEYIIIVAMVMMVKLITVHTLYYSRNEANEELQTILHTNFDSRPIMR